jgi:plastocyanin
MRKEFLALVALAAVFGLVVAGVASSGTAATPTLNGTVGPGFTIKLTKGGKKVTSLKAGTYLFVVSDKATIHNFTLEQEHGGKFETHITSVRFVGTKRVKITLRRGEWKYYCAPHEATMHGTFTVK